MNFSLTHPVGPSVRGAFWPYIPPALVAEGWASYWSIRESQHYFLNSRTNESAWELADVPKSKPEPTPVFMCTPSTSKATENLTHLQATVPVTVPNKIWLSQTPLPPRMTQLNRTEADRAFKQRAAQYMNNRTHPRKRRGCGSSWCDGSGNKDPKLASHRERGRCFFMHILKDTEQLRDCGERIITRKTAGSPSRHRDGLGHDRRSTRKGLS